VSDVLDVAIVGGGVSGTYAAWRLSTLPIGQLNRDLGRSGPKPLIQVFA
jgi:glycine/D-amino acid oxidase-like deaminating enzyme